MKPLPFTWPYFLLFWPIYVWVFVPEFRIIRSSQRVPIPPEDRGSLRLLMLSFSLAILAAFTISIIVPETPLPGHRSIWFFAGVLTLICGSLLRRHCFRMLDTFFTGAVMVQAGHRVIDRGAYRWLRHPSYSAALLIVLGISLALGNWLAVAVSFVLAFIGYSYRARVEERALLESLGTEYAVFLASRKRFIPFIY
jgi:protein-S-isoprenylcysteine O-methyltransferase Ste14